MSIEDLMNDEKCNYVGYDSFDKTDKNTKAIEELRQNVNTLNNEVDALSLNINTGDLQADMISATSVETATLLATSVETDALNAKEINLVRDLFIEGTNQDVGIVSIPENESVKVYMVSDSQSIIFSYSNGSISVQAGTGNIEKIDVYKNEGRAYFATYINNTDKVYYWTELADDVQPITDLAYLGYTLEHNVNITQSGTYLKGGLFFDKNTFTDLTVDSIINGKAIFGKESIDLPETLDPDVADNNVYIKLPPFVGTVKLVCKNSADDALFSMTFEKEIPDADGDIAACLKYTTKNLDYIKDVFSDLEGNIYIATRAFGTLWYSTDTFGEMLPITADQGVAPYLPIEDRIISYQPTIPARYIILGDGTLANGLTVQGELDATIIKVPEGISSENMTVSGLLNATNAIVENELQVPPPVKDNNATTKLYVDTADEAIRTEIDNLDTKLTSDISAISTDIDELPINFVAEESLTVEVRPSGITNEVFSNKVTYIGGEDETVNCEFGEYYNQYGVLSTNQSISDDIDGVSWNGSRLYPGLIGLNTNNVPFAYIDSFTLFSYAPIDVNNDDDIQSSNRPVNAGLNATGEGWNHSPGVAGGPVTIYVLPRAIWTTDGDIAPLNNFSILATTVFMFPGTKISLKDKDGNLSNFNVDTFYNEWNTIKESGAVYWDATNAKVVQNLTKVKNDIYLNDLGEEIFALKLFDTVLDSYLGTNGITYSWLSAISNLATPVPAAINLLEADSEGLRVLDRNILSEIDTLEAKTQIAQYTDPIQWGYTVTTSSTIEAMVANMPNNSKLIYSTTTAVKGPYMDGLPTNFGILEITKLSELRYILYWYESHTETKQVYYSQYKSTYGFSGWSLLYPAPDSHPEGSIYTKYKIDGKWATTPHNLWGGQWGVVSMTDTEVVYKRGKLNTITLTSNLGTRTFSSLSNAKSYISSNKASFTTLTVSGGINVDDTDARRMFQECSALQSLNLDKFDTSGITSMSFMFDGCTTLTNIDVTSFDTSNVTNMSYMFHNCPGLTSIDLSGFNTSNVTNMARFFHDCTNLTSADLSSFDTSNVTGLSNMFYGCSYLANVNLTSFDTSKVTSTSFMFSECFSLKTVDLSSFDTSKITSTSFMFLSCTKITTAYGRTQADCDKFNASDYKPSNVNFVVKPVIFLTSNLESGVEKSFISLQATKDYISANKATLTSITLRGKPIEGDTDMSSMFEGCSALTSLNIASFDTSNITNMSYMFGSCSSLQTLDLSSFNTSSVTNMSYMFFSCYALKTVGLSSFNTSNVTNMRGMFSTCRALTEIDLLIFDTSKVTNMAEMFTNCLVIYDIDLSSFNTSNVSRMDHMFSYCNGAALIDVLSFDTSRVTRTDSMFYNCSVISKIDLSSFNTSTIYNTDNMFYGCSKVFLAYGRTQEDCDKLNSSLNKPANVNFEIR